MRAYKQLIVNKNYTLIPKDNSPIVAFKVINIDSTYVECLVVKDNGIDINAFRTEVLSERAIEISEEDFKTCFNNHLEEILKYENATIDKEFG